MSKTPAWVIMKWDHDKEDWVQKSGCAYQDTGGKWYYGNREQAETRVRHLEGEAKRYDSPDRPSEYRIQVIYLEDVGRETDDD